MCMMHTANNICNLKPEIAANLLRNMFVASTVVCRQIIHYHHQGRHCITINKQIDEI